MRATGITRGLLVIICSCGAMACGGEDGAADPSVATSGTGEAGATATGGGGTGGDAGGGSAAAGEPPAGCPPWPAAALMPEVGPWFYGPHPGPCQVMSYGTATPDATSVRVYEYDADGLLSGSRAPDGGGAPPTFYTYERGLIVRIDDQALQTVSYTENQVTMHRDGQLFAEYYLDASGYVDYVLAAVTSTDGSLTTRFDYVYEDCVLVERTATDLTTGAAQPTLTYGYDADGNLVEKRSPERISTYDYGCWE